MRSASTDSDDDDWGWKAFINWPDDDLNRDLRRNEQGNAEDQAAVTTTQSEAATTTAPTPLQASSEAPATSQSMSASHTDGSDDVVMEDAPGNAPRYAPVNCTSNASANNDNVSANQAGDHVDNDDPVLRDLLAEPLFVDGIWEPQPVSALAPLDADGNQIQIDVDRVLEMVEIVMEGFETDVGYLAELARATSPLQRAELARSRFRRCWHILAVSQIAPAIHAAGYDVARVPAAVRNRPIYFVVGRDYMLESDAIGQSVRKIARFGWHPENCWAWISMQEENSGEILSPPNPHFLRIVDMYDFAEQHGIHAIYERRFPVVDDGQNDPVVGGNDPVLGGNAYNNDGSGDGGSSTADGGSNVTMN
ncbi:hypothetical protein PG988_002309 [Apiospora saccharicola]